MTTPRQQRIARASIIAIGVTAIAALALLTYADARRVLAERAAAEATTPQVEAQSTDLGLCADQAVRLARALSTARIDGATIIYVDDDAASNGDGTSWASAFNDLQDGLAAAAALGGAPAEIWVAAGTYKPDRGTGDRTMSFELVSNTGIYGGFAGDETDFDDRDFRTNETILTGDLLGNDVGVTGRDENVYHVVRADQVQTIAVDGLTITGGNANGESANSEGGGLRLTIVRPLDSGSRLANCRVVANTAGYEGGGLYASGLRLLVGCDITGNSATSFGGGASVYHTSVIANSRMECNTSESHGSAVYSVGEAVCFVNVVLGHNSGASDVAYTNGPTARMVVPSFPTWVNCTIVGNTSRFGAIGGGESGGAVTLSNCILWGNVGSFSPTGGSIGVSSSIDYAAAVKINYSCVMSWCNHFGGLGNTGASPNFVDSYGSDYRLQAPSSAIDAGDNGALPVDIVTDIIGGSRFVDNPLIPDTGVNTDGLPVVDMGAYEWFDWDCNGDGVSDAADIAAGTSADFNSNGWPDECEMDCNSNGWPDDYDMGQGVETDCNANRVPDTCDIVSGTSQDCNDNGAPDECDGDCNVNGLFDGCDLAAGTSQDCDSDGVPDECMIALGIGFDCDQSGTLDECDIEGGTAPDCNSNWIPDECELPYHYTDTIARDICAEAVPVCPGVSYTGTIVGKSNDGSSSCGSCVDTNDVWYVYRPHASGTVTIDMCAGTDLDTVLSVHSGCPGVLENELVCDDDGCEAGGGSKVTMDVTAGASYIIRVAGWYDYPGSYTLQLSGPECHVLSDCNSNGVPDECDIPEGTSADCNMNGVPDECDTAPNPDYDGDGTPDGCDDDVDGDGVLDVVDFCLFSPLGLPVNPFGGPMGDLDDDCLVTLDDYFYFEICLYLSGPNGDPGFQDCRDIFDFDGDGDVDLADYAAFARVMAG